MIYIFFISHTSHLIEPSQKKSFTVFLIIYLFIYVKPKPTTFLDKSDLVRNNDVKPSALFA